MRALIVITVLLLGPLSYGQMQPNPPPATTPAAPATAPSTNPEAVPAEMTPADAPVVDGASTDTAVTIPSAFRSGWFASPSFTAMKRDLKDATPPIALASDSTTMIDLGVKGGYTFEFGLFAGLQAMYSMGTVKGGGASNDITTYGVGPTVGYSEKYTGLFLTATYYLFGKTDLDAGGEFDEVTGLQVDLSYPMNLTENIKIGPQLTWKRLKNSDHSVPGVADYKTKDFAPSISAWFYF